MNRLFLISIAIVGAVNAHSQNFWEPANGQYGYVTALGTRSHVLFAGAVAAPYDTSKVYRSTDEGNTWGLSFAVPYYSFGAYVQCFASGNSDEVYMGSEDENGFGGIYRTSDEGLTWMDLGHSVFAWWVEGIAINGASHIFLARSAHIERSTNNGVSWAQVLATNAPGGFTSVAVNNSQLVFAGSWGSGVYRSTDNGGTWAQVNAGLGSGSVSCLFVDGGRLFVGTGAGLFRSVDNGDTWNQVLSNSNVRALASNASGHLFAGSWGSGVYRSTNKGDTWTQLNSGLTDLQITSLAINDNGRIFAGAPSGIFRSVESTVGVENTEVIPASFTLEQNYPNPFNPSTTIRYQLPTQSHVTLKVFDALGREVATLVNGVEDPGHKSVQWGATEVASGVYFYRLQAGGFVETRRLVLMK